MEKLLWFAESFLSEEAASNCPDTIYTSFNISNNGNGSGSVHLLDTADVKVGFVVGPKEDDEEAMVRILDNRDSPISWHIYECMLEHEAKLRRGESSADRVASSGNVYMNPLDSNEDEDEYSSENELMHVRNEVVCSPTKDNNDTCLEDEPSVLIDSPTDLKRPRLSTNPLSPASPTMNFCFPDEDAMNTVILEDGILAPTCGTPLSPILSVPTACSKNAPSPILQLNELSNMFSQPHIMTSPAVGRPSTDDDGSLDRDHVDITDDTHVTVDHPEHTSDRLAQSRTVLSQAEKAADLSIRSSASVISHPAVYDESLVVSDNQDGSARQGNNVLQSGLRESLRATSMMNSQYFMYDDSFTESQHTPGLVRIDHNNNSSSSNTSDVDVRSGIPKFDVNNVTMIEPNVDIDTTAIDDPRRDSDPLLLSSWPSSVWERVYIPLSLPTPELISRHCNGCIVYWAKDCFYIDNNYALAAAVSLATKLKLPIIVLAMIPADVYKDVVDIVEETSKPQEYKAESSSHHRFVPHRSSATVSFHRKSVALLGRVRSFQQSLRDHEVLSKISMSFFPVCSQQADNISLGTGFIQLLHNSLLFGVFCVFTDDIYQPTHDVECSLFRQRIPECPLLMIDSKSLLPPRSLHKTMPPHVKEEVLLTVTDNDSWVDEDFSVRGILATHGLDRVIRDKLINGKVATVSSLWDKYEELDSELQQSITNEITALLHRSAQQYIMVDLHIVNQTAIERFINATSGKDGTYVASIDDMSTILRTLTEASDNIACLSVINHVYIDNAVNWSTLLAKLNQQHAGYLMNSIMDTEFARIKMHSDGVLGEYVADGDRSKPVPWLDLLPKHTIDDVDVIHSMIVAIRNAGRIKATTTATSTTTTSTTTATAGTMPQVRAASAATPTTRRPTIYQTPRSLLKKPPVPSIPPAAMTTTPHSGTSNDNDQSYARGDVTSVYPILSFPMKLRTGTTNDKLFNAIQRSLVLTGAAPCGVWSIYWCAYYLTHCGGDMFIGMRACLTELATHCVALVETENSALLPLFIFIISKRVIPHVKRCLVQSRDSDGLVIDPMKELFAVVQRTAGGELALQQFIGKYVAD